MPRGKTYADNSYNRSIGRVGAPMGSMPVSASSRSSSGGGYSSFGSHGSYVDNSYNRSVGRVGMPLGSMPMSASSSGGGYSSFGSHGSYVDNSYNRSVGRVGMPLGSMPMSASSSGGGYSSSGSHGSYVDNSYNRSVGRVGMPLGSMPVSRSSSASSESSRNSSVGSSDTYVDNAYNRSVGRVGMPKGSMPVSKSSVGASLACGTVKSYSNKTSASSGDSSKSAAEGKLYKDNAFNRALGRAGMPLGSMPHSRVPTRSEYSRSQASKSSEKFYVDNPMNRKLGRVGLKIGTMPVSRTGSKNSRKQKQPTHVMNEMFDQLQRAGHEADDFEKFPDDVPEKELEYMCDTVFSLIRRMNQALKWKESNQGKQPRTALKTFKYDGPVVKFEEIEILEKIGHGGFGDVHFGKYKGTVVAVKKLRVQRVSQRRLRQFQEEVEILYRLDHPHIVRFIGASIITPNLAILMEYMQKSLFDALHVQEQDFTSKEQHQILLHMADGLAYLHGFSVAHCDMKSTNILLDSTDDGIVAKISDFGLSMMKSETETSQSTAKVQGVGTPKYSAPEVLAGEELGLPAMCKADVYSMSVVAWEVICQEVPFSGLNIHQLMRRVSSGDVNLKFPEDVQVGDGLKDLLKECWSRDANKRPSTQAFKDRLEQLNSIL
ncbi:dual specificity protein kinase splB-like [Patiria miniata]|uniref:Protein kinase domain-containing protein n=1 Tax=Patiria miniata TaxID=46514 RepID=A0A913Z861_PATMI|nr:dual specificity protein kinase splB-like [Patiria miniata]